ncbi:MAG TPA: hypothetical protein VL122_02330 [Nitrospirota bacterium]|nr:hypothetical protein [Nitrospirota bacterium]
MDIIYPGICIALFVVSWLFMKLVGRAEEKRIFTIFFLGATLVFPLRANAVVVWPIPAEREEMAAKGTLEKGDIVCLFQSGTADVRKAITMNDVLPVYRETKSMSSRKSGKSGCFPMSEQII